MKNQPLISVIVPVYGIERYIGICIESIINQTYRNLEIILVDDGSPDMSPRICDLYASKDPRIKVIHKENGGLVSARKAGIQVAQGEYVGYVDGDDWIGPGFYQALANAIIAQNADVVVAGFSHDLYNSSEPVLNAMPVGVYEGNALQKFFRHFMSYDHFFRYGVTTYLWNKLFRRELVRDYQLAAPNSINILEDAAVVYPAMLKAKKIVITDNCAYHYRQRDDSMLKTVPNIKVEAERLKTANHFMLDSFKDYPEEYHLKQQLDDVMLAVFIIRCGGITQITNEQVLNTIFNQDIENKKVIIYGAGSFGQQMYNRLAATNKIKINGWVDPFYWAYRRCGLDVDPVFSIASLDYDYILLAGLDDGFKTKVSSIFTDLGVSSSKILKVEMDEDTRLKMLLQYLQYKKN